MPCAGQWVAGLGGALVIVPAALGAPAAIETLKLSSTGDQTSLVVSLSDFSPYRMFTLAAPDRVVVDISSARLAPSVLPLPAGTGAIRQVRVANRPDGSVRVVLELAAYVEPKSDMYRASDSSGSRLVVDLSKAPIGNLPPQPLASDIQGTGSGNLAATPAVRATETDRQSGPATPDAQGTSIRADQQPIGRDIVIAVDAGHGGKDPGAHGPRGLLEKDVTLRIARRLIDTINAEPGMRGVLTRDQDEFIPLRGRMERARKAQADLFVSIHADAVRNRTVQGASIYVLNEKGATDEAAKRLAARENAADLIGGVSLGDKDPMLRSVLLDLSQNASLSSSIEVADAILDEMARVGTVRRRQVMQAPFMVLKSPDVPSVLIETAYISNPQEERHLDSHEYRGRLADAIFAGVRGYFYKNPPLGTLVAEMRRERLADTVQHVIRRGETLSAIADRYHISVQRIRDANDLPNDRVAVGQKILIPVTRDT